MRVLGWPSFHVTDETITKERLNKFHYHKSEWTCFWWEGVVHPEVYIFCYTLSRGTDVASLWLAKSNPVSSIKTMLQGFFCSLWPFFTVGFVTGCLWTRGLHSDQRNADLFYPEDVWLHRTLTDEALKTADWRFAASDANLWGS